MLFEARIAKSQQWQYCLLVLEYVKGENSPHLRELQGSQYLWVGYRFSQWQGSNKETFMKRLAFETL